MQKSADQLNQILSSLEASTFVKRFKAASREQIKVASNINQETLDAFGIDHDPVTAAEPIAKQAKDQSEIVRVIESDLDAYYQRKQDARFKPTLDEMKKTEIVRALAGDGDKVSYNLSGQAISGSNSGPTPSTVGRRKWSRRANAKPAPVAAATACRRKLS